MISSLQHFRLVLCLFALVIFAQPSAAGNFSYCSKADATLQSTISKATKPNCCNVEMACVGSGLVNATSELIYSMPMCSPRELDAVDCSQPFKGFSVLVGTGGVLFPTRPIAPRFEGKLTSARAAASQNAAIQKKRLFAVIDWDVGAAMVFEVSSLTSERRTVQLRSQKGHLPSGSFHPWRSYLVVGEAESCNAADYFDAAGGYYLLSSMNCVLAERDWVSRSCKRDGEQGVARKLGLC